MNRVQSIMLKVLQQNPSLLEFVRAYHAHLSTLNPSRIVGANRTDDERLMDALGRLMVGDEVCSAVILDDKWYISTNATNHLKTTASIYMERQVFQKRRTGPLVDMTTTYRIEIESDDGTKVMLREVHGEIFEFQPPNRLKAQNEETTFTIPPEKHGLKTYDDVFSMHFKSEVRLIHDKELPHFLQGKPMVCERDRCGEQCLAKFPFDPFQRRAGTLFFHLMMRASYPKHGKTIQFPTGEVKCRYQAIRKHRTRLMLQSFYWNAASWYPAFAFKSGRHRFYLDACQPTHRKLDIFLHLLPDNHYKQLYKKPITDTQQARAQAQVIERVRSYTRKTVAECIAFLKSRGMDKANIENAQFQSLLRGWCDAKCKQANRRQRNEPSELYGQGGAQEYFQWFEEYFISCQKLCVLRDFIEKITDECTAALEKRKGKTIVTFIKDWFREKHRLLSKNRAYPGFLNHADNKCGFYVFVERLGDYYIDIIRAETYVNRKCLSSDPADIAFADKLMDPASYEMVESTCLFVPRIIDHLVDESHAELRLFYYWTKILRRKPTDIPYLGITQLCCPNCRAFLKGHHLDFVEGQRSYAGIHGKHYQFWCLDKTLQEDGFLRPMLGPEAFAVYQRLSGEFTLKMTYQGQRTTRTESRRYWAMLMIQNLGGLTQEMMDRLKIPGGPLQPKSCNTVTEDFEVPEVLRTDAFFRRLSSYGLNHAFVPGTGACQFQAILQSLPTPELFPLLQTGNRIVTLRQAAVDHISLAANSVRFSHAIANEGYSEYAHQDVLYPSLEVYIEEMRKETTYGDHLTLQALAEILNVAVIVVQPTTHAQNPVQIRVIKPHDNFIVEIDRSPIIIFNGYNHYEYSRLRGNQAFRDAVNPPEQLAQKAHAAIQFQSLFRNFRNKKAIGQNVVAQVGDHQPAGPAC